MAKIIIPKAIKKCKNVNFNVCQYLPFMEVMEKDDKNNVWKWNGKSILVTDEVGVGKTFETGILLKELYDRKKALKIVIFCPAKLCSSWKKKLAQFGLDFNNYRENKMISSSLMIIPYSALVNKKGKEGRENKSEKELIQEETDEEKELITENTVLTNMDFCNKIKYDILVLDEAHYIRNENTVVYQEINKIIENNEKKEKKLKIFLSGTPIFNKSADNTTLTELLSRDPNNGNSNVPTTKTKQGTANLYDITMKLRSFDINLEGIEKEIYEEIYYGNYGELTGFLKRIAVSSFASLKEWLNKSDEKRLEMMDRINKEQEELMGDIASGNITDDETQKIKDDFERNKIQVTKIEDKKAILEKLKELVNGKWNESNDIKFQGLCELLSDLQKKDSEYGNTNNFKVVIFSTFISTCEYLKKRLLEKNYNVEMIIGGTDNVDEIIGNFRKDSDDGYNILVCSEAVREGQDLQVSHYLIHYDLPFTPASIGQRNGRIYRTGQERDSEIFYMRSHLFVNLEYSNRVVPYDISYDRRLFFEIIMSKYFEIINTKEIVDIKILPEEVWIYKNGKINKDNEIQENRKTDIKNKIIDEIEALSIKDAQESDDGKMSKDTVEGLIKLISVEENDERKQNSMDSISSKEENNIFEKLCNISEREFRDKVIEKGIMKYYSITNEAANIRQDDSITNVLSKVMETAVKKHEIDKLKVWESNKKDHLNNLKRFIETIIGEESNQFEYSEMESKVNSQSNEDNNQEIADRIENQRKIIKDYEKKLEEKMKEDFI